MLRKYPALPDPQESSFRSRILIPNRFDFIEACSFQPKLFPLSKCKVLITEVLLHDVDEVIERSILPGILFEKSGICGSEILIPHDKHELAEDSCSLAVSYSVEDGFSHFSVRHFRADGMGSINLVLLIPPCLAIKEFQHAWGIAVGGYLFLDALQTDEAHKVCETLLQP